MPTKTPAVPTASGETLPAAGLTLTRRRALARQATRYGYSVDRHFGNASHHGSTVSVSCPLAVNGVTWHRITATVSQYDEAIRTPLRALTHAVLEHLGPDNVTFAQDGTEHVCPGLRPARA